MRGRVGSTLIGLSVLVNSRWSVGGGGSGSGSGSSTSGSSRSTSSLYSSRVVAVAVVVVLVMFLVSYLGDISICDSTEKKPHF